MKKKNNIIYILFLVIFFLVFAFSIYKIYHLLNDHSSNQKEVQSIQDEIIINKEEIKKIEEGKVEEDNSVSYELELDFQKLREINSDTVGWIEIRNTHINYPIVQTTDNDYYLNHSFYKSDNGDGWIFLSYINHLYSDPNTVIFGHDTHGVSMFSDLKNLYNGSLGNSIPITIYTEEQVYHYETFSILLTEEDDNQYLKNRLYEKDIKNALKDSNIDFGIDVSVEDSILTLSTCYHNSSRKVILLAKRV